METRPKLKLKLSPADKIFEFLGYSVLLIIWTLVITYYQNLPDTIPIHYNVKGEADGFGNKSHMLMLPILATVLFAGMTILNKYPHIFNYPSSITQENAFSQYTNATRLIRFLKLIVVIIFGGIVFITLQHTNGDLNGIGTWFMPVSLALIFIPLIYFIVRSVKAR